MRVEQQPAFVLHARPYRETSLLMECLTRDHGRIGVVARGVRKERARMQHAQLEPFQRLELDLLLKGELATLRGAEPSGAAMRLLGDAGLAGLYLNELVVRLTGRQDHNADLFERYDRGFFHMRGYTGEDKPDHCAHLGLMADIVKVYLTPRWHTPKGSR